MYYVILPALDEASALRVLIPDIGRSLEEIGRDFQICVVDDGSSDGTRELVSVLAARWPVHIISHPRRLGYGAGLRTGLAWATARGSPGDIAATMDADNTHPPRYLGALAEKISEGFDVVTASYSAKGGRAFGLPPIRRALSAAANLLFRACRPRPGVRIYTNGYRAYRLEALQKLWARHGDGAIRENGFPGGTELFLKTLEAGFLAGEIPFELHYQRRGSASKMAVLKSSWLYLRLALSAIAAGAASP